MGPKLFSVFLILLSVCAPAHHPPPSLSSHQLPLHTSALSCSGSITLCKLFGKLYPEVRNSSSTTTAVSATNWCQKYEPFASPCLLLPSWFLWQCDVLPTSAPTLTFCACSASKIPQMVSSHDAHHLALQRQGIVQKGAGNWECVLS